MDFSVNAINRNLVPLLTFFSSEDLIMSSRKQFLVSVLEAIYTAPFLFYSLVDLISKDVINDSSIVGWFVIMLALSDSEISKTIRADPLVGKLCDAFATSTDLKSNQIGKKLKNIVSLPSDHALNISLDALTHCAGGRHSNDFADYRSILILATLEELKCTERSYLPTISDEVDKFDEPFYLDRHFRLLREDIVDTVREEFLILEKDKRSLNANEKKSLNRLLSRTLSGARIETIDAARDVSNVCVKVSFNKPKVLLTKEDTYASHHDRTTAEKKFWKDNSNLLAKDSLVLLMRNGECIHLGMVANRNDKNLMEQSPFVTISLFSNESTYKGLTSFHNDLEIVQLSATFFSSTPVLHYLQKIDSVPMAEHILAREYNENCTPPTSLEAIKGIYDGY